jgi:hypothetical protein
MPDLEYLPGSLQDYDHAYNLIPDEPNVNYKLYKEALEKPMPSFLGTPEELEDMGKFHFTWEEAYDFEAEDVSYHFSVATDWEFKNVIRDVTLTNTNRLKCQTWNLAPIFGAFSLPMKAEKHKYPLIFIWTVINCHIMV